jgi:hypothetical protein
MEDRAELWKITLFLSSQITQQIALHIISTNNLSFNGIQLSINQISSKTEPSKVKELYWAIQHQIIFTKWQETKIWSAISKQPQKTQKVSPYHPLLSNLSLVSIFSLSNHINIFIFNGILDFQTISNSWLIIPPKSNHSYNECTEKIPEGCHLQILISKIEGVKVTLANSVEREWHSCNKGPTNYLLHSNYKVPLTKALATVIIGFCTTEYRRG